MAQANAQIGIARIAYFPAATLSASAGLRSISISSWLQWPSRVWSVGPTLVETIFDGGLRKATMEQFQAAYNQTVAGYRQTVLIQRWRRQRVRIGNQAGADADRTNAVRRALGREHARKRLYARVCRTMGNGGEA